MALLASASRRLAARAARPGPKKFSSLAALGEEHQQIRDVARAFAEERLYPIAGEVARLHRYPGEVVAELG